LSSCLAVTEARSSAHSTFNANHPIVSGGGLTVIANAPNPAGQSILAPAFGKDGIAPGGLLVAALLPTIIMAGMFMLLP
jgi:hypothetical protein